MSSYNSWAPSRQSVEAVAQVQRTVDAAVHDIGAHVDKVDARGNRTGQRSYLVQPRAFLVIGCLDQLGGGMLNTENDEKVRSFELFRRKTFSPEILTFDELYARAGHIVEPHLL